MAWPAWWWLQPLTLAGLVWQLDRVSPSRAFALGWVFGTSWLLAAVWWLFISMHRYGGMSAWMSAAAVFLLCAALALYWALACAGFACWRRGTLVADSLLLTGLWLLTELARGSILTGFPWAASGYAHVQGPLAPWAPWVGVYGLGAVSALAVACCVLRGTGGRWWAIGLMGLGLGLVAVSGPLNFTTDVGRLKVALLQPNVPQQEKFSSQHLFSALNWTRDKLTQLSVDLVVAPETVVPLLPEYVPSEFWAPVRMHFKADGRHALFGLPLGDLAHGYTNSVAGLSSSSLDTPKGFYRYDKHHLVPFGEFVPTGFRWFTALMNIPLGDFNRGIVNAPSFEILTAQTRQWAAPNICFEDLFGEELATRFVGPQPPTLMVNVSNIAWFGNTIALRQHLQISRMRSMELQRPMLRATNTGSTAFIDHLGQVQSELPAAMEGVLVGEVEGRAGVTPFAWWAGRWGLWPLWALGALLVAASGRLPGLVRAHFKAHCRGTI